MKARFNYKSRKTIIITIAIIALLALSATGVYVFTKGNDNAEAFTENNNTVIDGSSQASSEENQSTQNSEQTIQSNIEGQNEENVQNTTENSTQNNAQNTAQGTTNVTGGTTTSTTSPNVPNNEYVTERQEEVERLVAEDYLVGWTPISLAAITSNIELNKDEVEPQYELEKVATLVNGEEIAKDENGKIETKVQKGDKVTYTITIRNTGNVTLQNIQVVDELINYNETIQVLAIGDEIVKTVEYTVNEQDMNENEEIVNVVKATATDPTDSEKTIEKEDEEIVPVNPYITISGTKIWVDYDNKENTRPTSITVEILNGNEVVDTITVTAKNGWNYTSKELPKYDAQNNGINYTVREKTTDKYTASVEGTKITNTLNYVPMVTVSGTKTWVDYDNKENTRPTSITVEILNGNDVVDTITVTAENGWNYTSKELPKYDAKNNVINYTVREQVTDKYTANVEGTDITNTLNYVPMVTVSGTKTWVDYDNKENTRPESITVEVLNGNEVVDTITVTAENGWNYTSKELPKYDAENNVINYTVREKATDKYIASVEGTDITNTLNYVPMITVSGTKTWVDYDNKENTRPTSITVEILNGNDVVDTITVTAENGWNYTSKELPKYDAENNVINYTVREKATDKYTASVEGTTITNTLNYIPMTTVSGTKTWVDYDNKENTRPSSITVEVLNGNEVVDTITVTAENSWSYTSKELPKYDAENNVINYTVREKATDKYTASVEGTTITNTLNYVPMVTVSGTKTWVDYDNKENTRPSSITVEVLNGNDVVDTITVTAENGWNYTSKELPKYDAQNNVINYTVREQVTDKYTASVEGTEITNTLNYIPMITVSGTKTWVDYDNKENTRPSSITVEVLNGNEVVDTITVTAENGWNYTSKELPKYDAQNNVINYTVREKATDKYTASVEDKNITNTLNYVPMVTVSGTKTWVDYDNKENTRPESITVEVLNGNEVVDTITVTAENGWNYTSKELPKYDAENNVINYTVREKATDKYTPSVEGTDITNTLNYVPKTSITVSKTWVDNDNQDGVRPTTIKVQLFANGVAQANKVVQLTNANKVGDNDNIWQYTFENLDKYDAENNVISYQIKELTGKNIAIEENGQNAGYTVNYEKDTEHNVVTITNSYTPQTTEVIASKVWVDNNNADKVRPEQITVKLYNGTTAINAVPTVVKNGNTWTYTFKDLPKYAAGKEIKYTAKELNSNGKIVANNEEYNDNYVTTYNGNTITNTLVKPNITVVKTSNKTNVKVEYGTEITYTLTATNSGNKAGNVTIKDTIPTGTELKEGSKIVVKVNQTTTNITKEQLEAGYEIAGIAANGNATITFTVVVKAYAGENIENTAYYKTNKDTEFTPTDKIETTVEDETTVIPTIAEVSTVTTKQRAILVLDVSGSMDEKIKVSGNGLNAKYETKLKLMKNAVNTFLTEFLKNGKNEVMIITYSSEAKVACDFTTNKTTAYNSIGSADGGTNIDAGLTLANSKITSDAENTSVILMTDGLPGRYIDNETGKNVRLSDGSSYNEKCGNEAIESAGWIKNKGSKVYSIGFGLDAIKNNSKEKAKELMQNIASPTTTNSDGTQNQYYYNTYDGEALNNAFKDIVNSITTITNSDPITLKTTQGAVEITKGFKEGQKVEVYTGTYNKDTSNPVATYTWNEFVALQYTTYANNTITFNLGKYMKDNNYAANTEISLRFVNE